MAHRAYGSMTLQHIAAGNLGISIQILGRQLCHVHDTCIVILYPLKLFSMQTIHDQHWDLYIKQQNVKYV